MMSMRLRLGLKKESIKNVELVLTSDYGVFMSTSRMSLNVFGFFTGEPTALELVVYRHPSLFNKLGFQYTKVFLFCFLWRCSPTRAMASPFLRFLDHTQRRITVGRTPLDEWTTRRRDLYLTTHKNSQQTNIHAPGGIRTHDLSKRAAADLRGNWDRQYTKVKL